MRVDCLEQTFYAPATWEHPEDIEVETVDVVYLPPKYTASILENCTVRHGYICPIVDENFNFENDLYKIEIEDGGIICYDKQNDEENYLDSDIIPLIKGINDEGIVNHLIKCAMNHFAIAIDVDFELLWQLEIINNIEHIDIIINENNTFSAKGCYSRGCTLEDFHFNRIDSFVFQHLMEEIKLNNINYVILQEKEGDLNYIDGNYMAAILEYI